MRIDIHTTDSTARWIEKRHRWAVGAFWVVVGTAGLYTVGIVLWAVYKLISQGFAGFMP